MGVGNKTQRVFAGGKKHFLYNTIYVYSIMLFFVRRRGESRFSSACLLGCEVLGKHVVVSFGLFRVFFPVCYPMFYTMFWVCFSYYCVGI